MNSAKDDVGRLTRDNEALRRRVEELEAELAARSPAGENRSEADPASLALARANRLYAFTSRINQLIVRVPDRQTLFAETCRIAVEHGKFRMAWIGLIDDKEQNVRPLASSGAEDGYLGKIKTIATSNRPNGRGPTGTAVREGKSSFCNDIANDARMAPWRDEALQRGYRSSIALPIVVQGGAIGAFSLYASEPDFFNSAEVRLLEGVTANIAYALEMLESAELRKQAEQELRQQESMLRDILDTLPVGVWIVDAQGIIFKGNQAGERLWAGARYVGLEQYGEYKGWWAATGKRIEPGEWAAARAITEGETSLNEEIDIECFDGTRKTILNSAAPIVRLDGTIAGAVVVNQDITERKRAEERLRLAADLIANISDAVVATDMQLNILSWNAAAEGLYGWTEAEVLHRPMRQFIQNKYVDDTPESVIRAASEQGFWRGEVSQNRRDGTRLPILATVSLVRDVHGNPAGFVAINRDITDRKQAESILLQKEAELEEAQRIGGVGSWIYALSGRIAWSREAYRIYGVSPETFVPHVDSLIELIHADDRSAMKTWIESCMAGSRPDELEFRALRSDGTVHLLCGRGELVCDAEGTPHHLAGTVQDITERKQAEAERERLTAAIEQADEMVYITDADGLIRYVNPAFEKVTGFGRDEAVGRNPRLLKSEKHDDAFYRELWKSITTGHTWRGRVVNKRKDGMPYTQEVSISPVSDTSGRIIHFVAVARDITEHLKLEEQLRASQKMDAIGRLAGGVAHDFNNLLSVILSYSDFAILRLREQDPLREDLVEIRKAGKRAADLTSQLLAFSRKQVLAPRILDVNEVVANLEKMLRRLIGEDIALERTLAPDLGRVRADPGQLEQVIMNLVVNARDAMPRGGTLSIETANVEFDPEQVKGTTSTTRPHVLVAITDTGSGMDEATQQRLFEPFFTTKERGTGLGLSTVYGIVKQSGGDVEVRSEPGKGTTFAVYLPRLSEVAQERTERTPEGSTVGTETILLVEDEEAVRTVAARILRAAGYNVMTAANGGEALLICERHQGELGLLLTDVVMPKMSGRELAERLQQVRPGLLVLYMSGYTDDSMVRHGVLEAGMEFIAKPFSGAALRRKVRDVLDEVIPDGAASIDGSSAKQRA